MVRQADDVARGKRKSDQKTDAAKREKKRRRASKDKPLQVDKRLLQILTGKDEEEESEKTEQPKISSESEAEESNSSTEQVEDVKEGEDDGSKTAGADVSGGVADAATNAISDAWPRQISPAHAKKVNITVLLERANLETVKQSGRSGGMVLLNCEDHRHILKKTGRDANDARPDITHQCLLALMDSPLNKAGRLKVYIRTAKNVLIEVHPQTRVPRTIRRFSGLMAELLEKFKVRGTSGSTPLLKVIRNPITSHLPVGTRKIVCTYNTENVVDMREHAAKLAAIAFPKGLDMGNGEVAEETIEEKAEEVNVLYVIGAMAHGKVSEDWADENICVSEYPLSAATVCSRLTYTYECLFGIL